MHIKKIRQLGPSAMVIIPKQIFEALGWQIGDSVSVEIYNGGLLFKKVEEGEDGGTSEKASGREKQA